VLRERANEVVDAAAAIVSLSAPAHSVHEIGGAGAQRLLCLCARHVVGYLRVIDQTLYAAADRGMDTRLLARALRARSERVHEAIDDLARADNPRRLAAAGEAVATLVCECVRLEQTVLIPALDHDAGLDELDLSALADAVEAGIARLAPAPPQTLDVCEIPLSRRYDLVVARCRRLAGGEWFLLISNLNPQSVRRELDALYPDEYHFEPVHVRPGRWHLRITRRASCAGIPRCRRVHLLLADYAVGGAPWHTQPGGGCSVVNRVVSSSPANSSSACG
jgi:uncharacterized protein (DUF2249 family)